MEWAQKTGVVITIEDNSAQGGFGSAVLELFSKKNAPAIRTRLLGLPDHFLEHGPQDLLWHQAKIDSLAIIAAAMELLADKKSS
jgi:1-deoxy-D-xylulose-5-phosphate synthase